MNEKGELVLQLSEAYDETSQCMAMNGFRWASKCSCPRVKGDECFKICL